MKKTKKAEKRRTSKKEETPIERLQSQNMRLTREIDQLGTIVAAQGELIMRVHMALQGKGLMSYEPICALPGRMEAKGPSQSLPKEFLGSPVQPVRQEPVPQAPLKGAQEVRQASSDKLKAIQQRISGASPAKAPTTGNPGMAFFASNPNMEFSVRAKIQDTTVGWLSKDGKWTLNPDEIQRFEDKHEAVIASQKVEPPKGAAAIVEGQATTN